MGSHTGVHHWGLNWDGILGSHAGDVSWGGGEGLRKEGEKLSRGAFWGVGWGRRVGSYAGDVSQRVGLRQEGGKPWGA